MTIRKLIAVLAIGAALALSSCGGGGGDGSNPPSNNWDSMRWDQGNWG